MLRRGIRSVLVASDLSDRSDDVVRTAAEISERSGAALHVIHAAEHHGRPLGNSDFPLVRLSGLLQRTRGKLHEQLDRALPDGLTPASVRVDSQNAVAAILDRIREVDADLVVVGPHREWMPGSHLLGSTPQRVVEEAAIPCLVAKGSIRFPLRRVLLPVAESDVRRGLLSVAGGWLGALGGDQTPAGPGEERAELRLLHVVRTPFEWRAFYSALVHEMRALGEDLAFSSRFELKKSIAWSRSPAREIVQTSRDLEPDIIAMGLRGHGALLRTLLGSVSATVLREAECPILLFPPRMCEKWEFTRASETPWESGEGEEFGESLQKEHLLVER
jgi:nucleotide-binding universal stress UspA family protein